MTEKSLAQAMVDALTYSMASDPNVVVVGNSFTGYGPEGNATQALFAKYRDRVVEPPTSEGVIASMAIGAAMAGSRPFVHFGTAVFAFEACNQILNEAGNVHFMSGGQSRVPLVFHMFHGIRGGGGAQHSQSPEAMYANAAGLQVMMPSTPADAQGLMRSALKGANPVIFLNHTKLLAVRGEVPDGDFTIPFGNADVKRAGKDVTVVATSLTVQVALKAAELLAREKIDVEVVDPRTIVPLDRAGICASVRKTGRLVVLDEANKTCSVAAEIAATVAEEAFDALKAPIVRLTRPDAPVAYSPPLEEYVTLTPEKVAAAVRRAMG
jgi:pyruvate dehydrogenase E1 component beta subunit